MNIVPSLNDGEKSENVLTGIFIHINLGIQLVEFITNYSTPNKKFPFIHTIRSDCIKVMLISLNLMLGALYGQLRRDAHSHLVIRDQFRSSSKAPKRYSIESDSNVVTSG